MELQYERFLRDEELRAQLEDDAHRARAIAVQAFLARSAQALLGRRKAAPQLRIDACG